MKILSRLHIDRNPSAGQLKVFGLLWLIFLGGFGILAYLKSGMNPVAIALGAAAVLIPAAGLAWPAFLRKVYVAAAVAAYPVGAVVSFAILLIIYYGVLTPIGLILRLAGHDPMKRKFEPSAPSYWVSRKPERDIRRYFQQF